MLASKLGQIEKQSSEVSARARVSGYEPAGDGIVGEVDCDDRHRAGGLLGGGGHQPARDDHVDLQREQLVDRLCEGHAGTFSNPLFHDDALAFDLAGLTHTLKEGFLEFWREDEKPDPRHLARPLRLAANGARTMPRTRMTGTTTRRAFMPRSSDAGSSGGAVEAPAAGCRSWAGCLDHSFRSRTCCTL